MRGVCLASGRGTRLGVITKEICNKHLALVYDRPMIYYPLETLVKSGIDDIAIVIGGSHCDKFVPLLKNGKELGIRKLTYIYQENSAGIAQALSLCEDFANFDDIAVILGDNYFEDTFEKEVQGFPGNGAGIFLKSVQDPQRFGVAVFDPLGETVVKIEEKPKKPRSTFAVTGLYFYDNTVFDKIRTLKPSSRGELEISSANNKYIAEGNVCSFYVSNLWSDMGVFDSLQTVAAHIANKGVR